jgi:hypothetical protein
MDYKEIHQNCYEELCEELGREPNLNEINTAYMNYMSGLVDAAKDRYKYGE